MVSSSLLGWWDTLLVACTLTCYKLAFGGMLTIGVGGWTWGCDLSSTLRVWHVLYMLRFLWGCWGKAFSCTFGWVVMWIEGSEPRGQSLGVAHMLKRVLGDEDLNCAFNCSGLEAFQWTWLQNRLYYCWALAWLEGLCSMYSVDWVVYRCCSLIWLWFCQVWVVWAWLVS
jgi:hypothetical protein